MANVVIRHSRAPGLRWLVTLVIATACSERTEVEISESIPPPTSEVADISCDNASAQNVALFGDVHVHTSFSFDAAANSTGATPADANRYARGEAIPFFPIDDQGNPAGTAQIDRPLDFLAVTDHGEFLGERAICRTEGSPKYATPFCENFRANERQGMMMLATAITTTTPARIPHVCGADGSLCLEYAKTPWAQIQAAANEANTPCEFTSFIGYEYTGTPGTSNYHRNVIFRNASVPDLPVSYIDAPIDSKLWAGLDALCKVEAGCDYLTIPHNSNLSNGRMAPYMQLDTDGESGLKNKQAYARTRLQREPIMEIFQHKGGSECVNGLTSILGQPDELCGVEAVRRMGEAKTYVTRNLQDGELTTGEATQITSECAPGQTGANGMLGAGCVHPTDYQRSALVIGLAEAQAIGLNPIKLGTIAATDTHSATPGNVAEDAWLGAVTGESTPLQRLQPGLLTSGIDGNPGGLAGVWATQNTRDAIFDAMLRREVFGTSGPRIVPRLFAGWDLPRDLCDDPERVPHAYEAGVPMGGDLERPTGALRLMAQALRDPQGQPLYQLQIIKGWVGTGGSLHTSVTDVATAPEQGADELCVVYEDTEFEPDQPGYYYLRVLQPSTPRWHTYDCAAVPAAQRPSVCSDGRYPTTVREMAWTSPIWYAPDGPVPPP
ncbi:MAG: DUF3604 domain-containing protein [Pseudomonadota bacterium]